MSKKDKKKSYKALKTETNYYRLFVQSKHKDDFIEKIKQNASFKEIGSFINKLNSNKLLRNTQIDENVFICPKTIECLKKKKVSRLTTIERYLFWDASILYELHDSINEFLLLKKQFENIYLKGNFKEASIVLEQILNNHGWSIWLLEQTILLKQKMGGIVFQKEFVKEVEDNISLNGLVKVYCNYISIRTEKEYSPHMFRRAIQSAHPEQYVRDILIFNTNYYDLHNSESLYQICQIDSNHCLIDKYIALIKSLTLATIYPNHCISPNAIIEVLKKLNRKIDDHKIINLLMLNEVQPDRIEISLDEQTSLAIDEYTQGNYEKALHIILNILEAKPTTSELYEIFIKSSIQCHINISDMIRKICTEDSPLFQILTHINRYLLNSAGIKLSTEFFEQISLQHSSHDWAATIKKICSQYHDIPQMRDAFSCYKFICESSFNPKALVTKALSDNTKKVFLDVLNQRGLTSLTLDFFKAINNNDESWLKKSNKIPEERKTIYSAMNLIKSKRYEEAKKIITDNYESLSTLSQFRSQEILCESFLNNEEHINAIELALDYFFHNNESIFKLPIRRIIEKIISLNKAKQKDLQHFIQLPIIFDIFSRNISNKHDDKRKHFFEAFLIKNNIERPSHVNLSKYKKDYILYFFETVCSLEIMCSNYNLPKKSDRILERINICKLLTTINTKEKGKYTEEIKKLTIDLKLKELIQYIEKSKISVNSDVIKETCRQELEEQFLRYITFKDKILDDFLASNKDYDLSKSSDVHIVIKSNGEQLVEMVKFIRDTFVSSDKHSLNGVLSGGIRHGTLETQLRAPFEKHNVLTKKTTQGEYLRNDYFLNPILLSSLEIAQKINTELNEFSTQIDSYIKSIWNDWMRIYDSKLFPEGLFDVDIPNEIVYKMDIDIGKDTTFDSFFDQTLSLLKYDTERCLQKVRQKLTIKAKERFREIVEQCLNNIRNIDTESLTARLISEISASFSELQQTLDKVADWFHLPEAYSPEDTTIDFPFKLGREVITQLYPSTNFEVVFNENEDILISGCWIKTFYEVVYILFENAIKYSKQKNNTVTVQVSSKRQNKDLVLNVSNLIDYENDSKKINQAIIDIEKMMQDPTNFKGANSEGNSGYVKLKRYLAIDLNAKYHSVSPSLNKEKTHFSVEIRLDYAGVYR